MLFASELINKIKKLIEIDEKVKIVTAESCTGGLMAALITSIAGCSEIFEHGFITYSYQAKNKLLGVPMELLNEFKAVSAEVAKAMAQGSLNNSDANMSIAITGLAGPGTGGEPEPVGTVFIGCSYLKTGKTLVKKYHFTGDRDEIRLACLSAATDLLLELVNSKN